MNFSVTDGQNFGGQHQMSVMARRLETLVTRNSRLHVFPMMQQSITSSHLVAVTSDYGQQVERAIRYQVVRAPQLGRLLLEQADGSTKLVTGFTQRDLNQSLLIYEHTQPFADLSVNDSFTFDVGADLSNSLHQQQFTIEISVASMAEGGLDRYLGKYRFSTRFSVAQRSQPLKFHDGSFNRFLSTY